MGEEMGTKKGTRDGSDVLKGLGSTMVVFQERKLR